MEEKIISEEQLEIMRHKARKRQNIAIVLTFLAFVLYIGMFYVALIEKEGMSVDELFRQEFRAVPFEGGEWNVK